MSNIRILFIDARADIGGGSRHLQVVLKALDRTKIQAFTASPGNQALSNEFKTLSYNHLEIPFRKFSIRSLFKLKFFAIQNRINSIHSHGRGAGIYSRLLGFLTGIPVIHTFHGISDVNQSLASQIALSLERILAFQTARFIHVSESERAFGAKMKVSDPDRSVVILNGIDLNRFSRNEKARSELRSSLGYTDDHFVIGCVARFDPCKRHEDIVLAMNRLILKHPNARLLLIGTGELERDIARLIQNKALGSYSKIQNAETSIESYYSAFDVFVLPSSHEGLPLSPIEAMASNCPVVLTDVRGNQDIVINHENGLLAKVREPEDLAMKLELLIQNAELRKMLAHAGLQTAKSKFDQNRMIKEIEDFYCRLVPIPEVGRVALVHDWLFHMRGGEKVLEAIGELFPTAPIYTLFLEKSKLSTSLRRHQIVPSFLNCLPKKEKYYRYLLPLFPFLIKLLRFNRTDLIISSSHCVAKGIRKNHGSTHICYCHAPMRYAWGFTQEYFGHYSKVKQWLIKAVTNWLKKWDLESNQTVDFFVANSENVKKRIDEFYHRDADVIYPPIKITQDATDSKVELDDFYLIVSALVPYKRVDLAVQAFRNLKSKLIVVGDGPLAATLTNIAGENVQLLGWKNDSEVSKYYQRCKALIFPTEEDFGMVPVEAMSWGKPVIAFGKGGALETVIPAKSASEASRATGIFFDIQTPESLAVAIERFETYRFDSQFIKNHAMKFERAQFIDKMTQYIKEKAIRHD